jgi:cytochrome c2
LSYWFGNKWQSEGNQVVFFAKDGYRSAISSQKLIKYQAYLAFARSDNKAFTVDNLGQNQQTVALGPYYLIWANIGNPELINFGAYDWPYQVTQIDLQNKDIEEKLHPKIISSNIESGLKETEKYCLNCHSIRGIGGQKYPIDLIQATCRWQKNDLSSWINAPSLIKPGTNMPPLNRMLAPEERGKVITHIVDYLQAMKTESPSPCAAKR